MTKAKSSFFSSQIYEKMLEQNMKIPINGQTYIFKEPLNYDAFDSSEIIEIKRPLQNNISDNNNIYPYSAWRSCKNLNVNNHSNMVSDMKQFDMNVLNVTDNIVAAIDPTFKRRYSLKDLNLAKKEKTNDTTLFKNKTLGKKFESSYLLNDSIMKDESAFIPIQGQKRTNTLRIKKKKSVHSQCLQQ